MNTGGPNCDKECVTDRDCKPWGPHHVCSKSLCGGCRCVEKRKRGRCVDKEKKRESTVQGTVSPSCMLTLKGSSLFVFPFTWSLEAHF